MTKRYVLSREDLQNLIHETFSFFSEKAKNCMNQGIVPMFSDRVKWIDEFLNSNLKELPVDELMDTLDESLKSFMGRSLDEIKNDLRKKNFTQESIINRQEEIKKFLDEIS